jgi:hypothetical protein
MRWRNFVFTGISFLEFRSRCAHLCALYRINRLLRRGYNCIEKYRTERRIRRVHARRAQTFDDSKLSAGDSGRNYGSASAANGVSNGSAHWVLLRKHGWMLEAQTVPGIALLDLP